VSNQTDDRRRGNLRWLARRDPLDDASLESFTPFDLEAFRQDMLERSAKLMLALETQRHLLDQPLYGVRDWRGGSNVIQEE
jgi:hypothetical protein